MIYEIDRNIYRIVVPLAGSPLGTLNAYYFRGPEEEYLMDTGFNTPECEATLHESLASLGYRPERLNIINTHLHADHTGLNHRFLGEKRHVYMSCGDRSLMKRFYEHPDFTRGGRDLREGADAATFEAMLDLGPGRDSKRRIIFDEETYVGLTDGQLLELSPCTLQTVVVPGHTPGNTMFYLRDRKIMFTGDHILFDITPSISYIPENEDALPRYLSSLEYARQFDVALALPGHRSPGDYQARIDRIILHHQHRLAEIVNIVGNEPGLTAYEIARRMRWRIHLDENGDFPPEQMWFAAGECMSHLDKLVADGRLRRIEGEPYITYQLP